MSDSTLSAAIREAYAAAPAAVVIHHTLEIMHSSFVTPIRVVRDFVDLTATLEADAPEDPGGSVTFTAYAFDFTPPDVNDGGSARLVITIDNVARDILAAIEGAMSSTNLLSVIYRAYLSTDLTGPHNDPPLAMTITEISATPMQIRAVAGFVDVVNKRFPSHEYEADTFPGLIAA